MSKGNRCVIKRNMGVHVAAKVVVIVLLNNEMIGVAAVKILLVIF